MLYEVTVKKVDQKRLDDLIQSLSDLGNLSKSVTFICRIPEDIQGLGVSDNRLLHKGKRIDFVDIQEFIKVTLLHIAEDQIQELTNDIVAFVSHQNRKLKTKEGYNKIFQA